MSEPLLTFVHISDTHLHHNPAYTGDFIDFPAQPRVEALIEALNALPFHVDFVLHTGDVMTDPETAIAYDKARSVLGNLKLPIHYLTGNHDRPQPLQVGLLQLPAENVKPRYYYEFEVNGVQIICLDTHIVGEAAGWVDTDQLAWLSDLCQAEDTRPLVIALHHHAIALGAPWLDRIKLKNGDDVHRALLPARDRLRGVFYGHIHESICTTRDGINYFSILSSWFQTRTWHGQQTPFNDVTHLPGYNVVTLTETDTFVRQYRLPLS